MTKREFIAELCLRLRSTPPDEAQNTVLFYSEAIDDRIEDGMTEEEAVAAMGSIDDIVRSMGGSEKSSANKGFNFDFNFGGDRTTDKSNYSHFHRTFSIDGVNAVNIVDSSRNVTLLPSPDGLIHVEYDAYEEWEYEINEGPTLSISRRYARHKGGRTRNFSFFGINVTVPDFEFSFGGSDTLTVRIPQVTNLAISATTASGDVNVSDLSAASLAAKTASGELEIRNIKVTGKLTAAAASGDLTLNNLLCDEFSAHSVSGDVDVYGCSFRAGDVKSVSGDVDLDGILASDSVRCQSVSGDVDCTLRDYCGAADFESLSGDITANLYGAHADYFITATTRSGDLNVPPCTAGGVYTVRAKSASGDISFDFTGR